MATVTMLASRKAEPEALTSMLNSGQVHSTRGRALSCWTRALPEALSTPDRSGQGSAAAAEKPLAALTGAVTGAAGGVCAVVLSWAEIL